MDDVALRQSSRRRRRWRRRAIAAIVAIVGGVMALRSGGDHRGTPERVGSPRSTTTASTASPASPSLGRPLDAATVLAGIPVENEQPSGYDRDLFPVWLDVDGDGCDTRNQVLRRDSLTPAQVDPVGCQVIAGDWRSRYDGATWEHPGDVDIDHVVSLKEAWDSGARSWGADRRIAFANDTSDPRTLVVSTDSVNASKGDKDPSNWLPPRHGDWCRFVGDWIAVKARWALTMDQSEAGRLRNLLRDECPGLTLRPWPAPPATPSP